MPVLLGWRRDLALNYYPSRTTPWGPSLTSDVIEPAVAFSTLVKLLRWRALRQPEQRTHIYLIDGEVEGDHLTHATLDRQARSIAALLQNNRADGERALLLYPAGLEFIAAFFGCLYAGVIAVPLPAPNLAQPQRTLPRLRAVISDAQPSVVLTTSAIFSNAEGLFTQAPELRKLRWVATDEVTGSLAQAWRDPDATSNTVALLQYTSGSTAEPKGRRDQSRESPAQFGLHQPPLRVQHERYHRLLATGLPRHGTYQWGYPTGATTDARVT